MCWKVLAIEADSGDASIRPQGWAPTKFKRCTARDASSGAVLAFHQAFQQVGQFVSVLVKGLSLPSAITVPGSAQTSGMTSNSSAQSALRRVKAV